MSDHTPGPWSVLGENLDGEIEVVAGGETICIVLPIDESVSASWDARLIAAAPDLYEALKRIASGKGELCASRDPSGGIMDAELAEHYMLSARELRAIARAAIAKTGGAQ